MRSKFMAINSLLVVCLTLGGIPNHGQDRPSEMQGPDKQEKKLLAAC